MMRSGSESVKKAYSVSLPRGIVEWSVIYVRDTSAGLNYRICSTKRFKFIIQMRIIYACLYYNLHQCIYCILQSYFAQHFVVF